MYNLKYYLGGLENIDSVLKFPNLKLFNFCFVFSQSVEEMDDYCKKHCINSFAFINDNSVFNTAQVFSTNNSNDKAAQQSSSVKFSVPQERNSSTTLIANSPTYVKIRSSTDRGYRSLEKKLLLNDFLSNSNQIINNMASLNPVTSSYLQASGFFQFPASSSSSTVHHQTTSAMSSSFGSSLSLASSTTSNPNKGTSRFYSILFY